MKCPTCAGTGRVTDHLDFREDGNRDVLFDHDCPDCIGAGRCPQCGAYLLGVDALRCAECGWSDEDDD